MKMKLMNFRIRTQLFHLAANGQTRAEMGCCNEFRSRVVNFFLKKMDEAGRRGGQK